MPVISIINQKGGTGKTTIAIAIASALKKRSTDNRVQLLDLDEKQRSAFTWSQLAEGKYFDVCAISPEALKNHIERNKGVFDYFIVDCPPRSNESASRIINASDVVLIPVQPSPYDVWASNDLIELILTKQELTKSIPGNPPSGLPRAGLVLSCVIKNTRIYKEVNEVMQECGLNVMRSKTTQFDTYKRSALEGATIFDCKEINKEAITQINDLTNEILEMLDVN